MISPTDAQRGLVAGDVTTLSREQTTRSLVHTSRYRDRPTGGFARRTGRNLRWRRSYMEDWLDDLVASRARR